MRNGKIIKSSGRIINREEIVNGWESNNRMLWVWRSSNKSSSIIVVVVVVVVLTFVIVIVIVIFFLTVVATITVSVTMCYY